MDLTRREYRAQQERRAQGSHDAPGHRSAPLPGGGSAAPVTRRTRRAAPAPDASAGSTSTAGGRHVREVAPTPAAAPVERRSRPARGAAPRTSADAPGGPTLRARRVAALTIASLAVGSAAVGALGTRLGAGDGQVTVAGAQVPTPPAIASPAGRGSAEPSPAPGPARPRPAPPARPSTAPPARPSTAPPAPRRAPASPAATPVPTPTAVPTRGTGRTSAVTVPGADTSRPGGRRVTYALEVEDGLGADHAAIGRTVAAALRDGRGWQAQDDVRFVQLTPQQRRAGTRPDVTITVAGPELTDRMCAPLQTDGELSCANHDHAVLNYRRWVLGAAGYGTNLDAYRTYLVNHEVGHELGHAHARCPGPGRPAPIMLQQSKGLDGCRPNPFPTVA